MTWLDLLTQTLEKLRDLGLSLSPYLPALLLTGVWCAWWLAWVNWNKFWLVLAKGAWVPVVLLAIITVMVWTQLQPIPYERIPNGWWQAGFVALVAATALFCGWLQGYFGWMPPEISVEPPAHGDGHAHH